MAQKKKASAAARHTAASTSSSDVAPESQGAENEGGAQRRKDGSGKGDSAAKGSKQDANGAPEDASAAVVRGECEKALVALRRGNSAKALRLIKEACARHAASGVVQRVQGHICMRLAAVIEDAGAKHRHFAAALESARRATALAPQSVEYALFCAQLLFEAATDSTGYSEVVRECERALRIEHPMESPPQPELGPTTAHARQELQALVQKANLASISSLMKTLGDDKLRFVKLADQAPLEHRVSPKPAKTPEQRRQEIEVRVAAAQLLQQQQHGSSVENHEQSWQKKLEKRKSKARNKLLSPSERIHRVRAFWHSLSHNGRETKLVVSIPELKEHASSSALVKDHASSSDVLLEALEFAHEKKSWRFWECCECGARVLSCQDLRQHLRDTHLHSLPEQLQQVAPREISREWAQQLLDTDFRPLDVRKLEIPCQDLPLADDEVRAKLLEKISSLFRALIRSKYLAQDHAAKIVVYAIEELQALVGAQYEFHQSPLYVRFLDVQPLLQIEKYLMGLAQACGVSVHSVDPHEEVSEERIHDMLFWSEDFTQLLLDERVVKEVQEEGEGASQHVDLQLSWIFGATEHELQASGWMELREEQGQRGRDVFRVLEKEFQKLYSLCDKKYELVCYEEALNLVERLCVEENRRREVLSDGSGKRFEAVLRDRQQELVALRGGGFSVAQKVELDAISNVLRDARAVMVPRHGVRVSDLDEAEDEAWRLQESLPRADSRVEHVILRQKEQLSLEIIHLDAKIMKATDDLQNLEIKLGQLTVLDYTAVVLPLVKSFLQSRLEAETEKDALQKADAAREAFLAELAKDQKSSGSKEHGREKSKEKKKAKDQKKFKDVKRGPSNSEQQGEAVSVEADEVDDADNWGWTLEDGLRQQRDTEIHQTLLWEEERKLLEALEAQRRVEEEAKQRHLNEQERKKQIAQQVTEPLEDGKITFSPAVDDVASPILLPTSFMQLSLVEESGCQGPAEVANQKSLPLVQTNDSLLAQIDHSVPDQIDCRRWGDSTARVEMVKDSTFEELGAGKNSGDGDHFNAVQKKTRGNGNRNRRKRGPRIYAEEGMIADQDAQPWKTPETANGPRTPSQQNAWKENGSLSTTEKPKPLSRQNASRSFGAAPANGMPAAQPLLLLPAPPSYEGAGAHEGKKTLRQLQAEQDEERFQAEMKLAMRQSLDMLTSQPRTPIPTSSAGSSPSNAVSSNGPLRDQRAQQMVETSAVGSLARAVESSLNGAEEAGKGLRNEIGQYNCFLNVVIQSLWHLRRFREDLLATSSMQHAHVGNPCVVCALRDIFLGLDTPANISSNHRDAVAPTALRVALSALYSDSDFFQEAQMNDASEVLAVIFECLHKAFIPNSSSDGDSESSTAGGSWDCQGPRPCMAHALFGLNIAEQMNCQYCGLESRHLKYTTFFHNINASALRTAKVLYQECSMDELLKLVDLNHQLACDAETGGCGRQNHIHHLLHAAPSVFTTVLGWQNGRESFEDISATVDAMDVSLDVGVIYRGLDEGFQHRLVSVVCYYGQHYHCFAYNHELGRWVMFDDSTVKVIGEWRDVASTCRRGHLQPQVLFYEAVSGGSVSACWTPPSSCR